MHFGEAPFVCRSRWRGHLDPDPHVIFIILTEPILRGHALSFELIKHGFIWNDSRTARHTWNSRLTDQKHCEKLPDPFERSCFYQDWVSLFCSQRMRCSYYGRKSQINFSSSTRFFSQIPDLASTLACGKTSSAALPGVEQVYTTLRCAAQSAPELKHSHLTHDMILIYSLTGFCVLRWDRLWKTGSNWVCYWLVIRVQGQWSLLLRWFAWFIHNGTAKTSSELRLVFTNRNPSNHRRSFDRLVQWVISKKLNVSMSGLFLRFMLNTRYIRFQQWAKYNLSV